MLKNMLIFATLADRRAAERRKHAEQPEISPGFRNTQETASDMRIKVDHDC